MTLKVTTPSTREIALPRVFDAPRRRVFDAYTKPELLKRWLLGPPGTSMLVCDIDPRVGGRYRYQWKNDRDGTTMGVGGVYREVSPPDRLVATEKFDQAWYPGEAVVTITFVEQGGKTTLTTTILYETPEARDMALKARIEAGMGPNYDRLAELLATQ